MKIYIYKGGRSLVAKSGVGSAIRHQKKMLRAAGVIVMDVWKEADVVQINTVLPDSPLVTRLARRRAGVESDRSGFLRAGDPRHPVRGATGRSKAQNPGRQKTGGRTQHAGER